MIATAGKIAEHVPSLQEGDKIVMSILATIRSEQEALERQREIDLATRREREKISFTIIQNMCHSATKTLDNICWNSTIIRHFVSGEWKASRIEKENYSTKWEYATLFSQALAGGFLVGVFIGRFGQDRVAPKISVFNILGPSGSGTSSIKDCIPSDEYINTRLLESPEFTRFLMELCEPSNMIRAIAVALAPKEIKA